MRISSTSQLGLGFGQRTGLGGLRLSLVYPGLVLSLDDGGLTGELGLLVLCLLLDSRVVRCRHCIDAAESVVVDGLDLQGVDVQADADHLLFGTVEDLGCQLLTFPDDLPDGHRADDRAQVTGEDPAGKHRHLVLFGQESLRGADDALKAGFALLGRIAAHGPHPEPKK